MNDVLKPGEVLEVVSRSWAKDERGGMWVLVPETQLDRLGAIRDALGLVVANVEPAPKPQPISPAKPDRVAEGRRLRQVRENHAVEVEVLARRAGLTAEHLGNLEKGKTEISRDNVVALSKALVLDAYVLAQAVGVGGNDRWGFAR